MRLIITFVDSDVVGEETRLEVGEGISSSREGKVERAMGFEPTTSCLGSWFQARLFVNTRKATNGLTPSGEKWLIEVLHTFSKAIPNPPLMKLRKNILLTSWAIIKTNLGAGTVCTGL